MRKKQEDLKLLLFQIRDDTRVQQEEYESFLRYSELKPSQLDILNVFSRPSFTPDVLDPYDAMFIGGASEASVMEPDRYPFIEEAKQLVLYAVDQGIPVFASCFGFQLTVIALGGTLVRDEEGFEMGTPKIYITEAGRRDPLFRDTPNTFRAVSVHQERTPVAPPGVELLAYSDACPHAFKVDGSPFWAFQFHPEVDRSVLIQRLRVYQQKYTENAAHFNAVIEASSETPVANALVKKFIQRIVISRGELDRIDGGGDSWM